MRGVRDCLVQEDDSSVVSYVGKGEVGVHDAVGVKSRGFAPFGRKEEFPSVSLVTVRD
jgi:hypothetical protein